MKKKEPDNRMANELLASASILEVLPSVQQKVEFAERALQTVLGLQDGALCLKGFDGTFSAKSTCAKCGVKNTVESHESFECPLSQDKNHRVIQVRTIESFFGYFIIPEASIEKSFLLDDLLVNFLTILSISIENFQKNQRIQDFNKKLQSEISERSQVQQSLTESEERYHSLFTHMEEGLAYCQMQFDAQDRPVDFVYLAVNDAFERLTGLKDVTGKKVTEVIPGIKKSSPELFEIYGRVALTGKPEKFETHFTPLDSWLSISVYSTQIGYFVAVFDNITERKRAEEILRQNEERLMILFEFAPDAYYLSDLKGNFVDGNKSAEELLGYNRTELIGKSFLKLKILSPIQIKKAALLLAKNIMRKSTGPDEFVLNRKDGSQVTVEIRTQPVNIHNKTLVLGIAHDITERKQAAEEIKGLSKFPSENPFPVLRLSHDGTVLYANAASEALLRLWKCSIGDRVPGFWRDIIKEVLASQIQKTIDIQVGERTFSFVLTPVSDLAYVNLYGSDITERKRAEDHLKRMIERFDLSTRAGRMGVWDWDVQNNQLIWDDRMYELYGIKKQNFTGAYEAWLNGIHPDDAARSHEESKKALSGEKKYDTEFRVIWPDKTVRHLKAYAQVVRDSDGKPLRMTGINYDITEQRLAEEKLKSLLKEKEVLIREVHHRVKNNFAVVSSLLNLQSRDIKDNAVQEMFIKSRDRIKSMALLHERLYQSQDLTHINLAEYIRTLAADLYQTYGTDPERISIVTEMDDVFPDVDKVTPCGLVVNELISNALKYGFPKSREGKGQIKVTLHKINGNEVELAVTDDGVGLPEDFDIHKTKSLGLKLVTMLAEGQLGGKLKVNGEGGAKFQIQFALQTSKE